MGAVRERIDRSFKNVTYSIREERLQQTGLLAALQSAQVLPLYTSLFLHCFGDPHKLVHAHTHPCTKPGRLEPRSLIFFGYGWKFPGVPGES